jgi:hypothetical protein
VNRLTGVERADNFAQRALKRTGCASNKKNKACSANLSFGKVNNRKPSRYIGPMKFYSWRYADDFKRSHGNAITIAGVRDQPFPDWVFSGEVFFGQGLVDDNGQGGGFVIAR